MLACSWVRVCAEEAAAPSQGISNMYEPAVIQEFYLADADVEIRKTDLVCWVLRHALASSFDLIRLRLS